MYLREAFKALEALNEDTFSVSDDGIQKLSEFEQNDDLIDDIPVIDLEAETEDDLQDSYVGKVILDCTVCHSKIYKDKSEVTVDDNVEFANVGEECPYCYTSDGFKIIGEVTEYGDEEEKVETDKTDNEDTEEDNKIEESLNNKDLSEATEFTEPELLGKGCCAPVATLPSERELRGIFKSLNSTNPKEKEWAKDDLNRLIERIKDTKQTFDNFNEYWKIHYQTALDAMQSLQDTINKELGDDTVNEFLDANVTLDARGSSGKDNNVSVLGSSLPIEESKSIKESIVDILTDEQKQTIDDIAYKYCTSSPVSGDWDVETAHECEAIADKLNISVEDAKLIMKDYLGFPTDELDKIKESKSIKESVNNVNVETDDSIVNVATDDTGKVTVTTEPNTNTDKGDEVLAPLSDETEQMIVDNSFGEDEDFTEVDVEEFDEESFDELGESYLKNIYENVQSYKTSKVTQIDNKIKVEGVIKFTSGASKNTTFLFEAKDVTKSGVVRFIGENVNITKGVKAFTIKGNVNNKKFITESFNYNYKTKKADGTLNRVFGTLTSRKG